MELTNLTEENLKQIFKQALTETLQEQRGLLYEVVVEAMEDISLAEAIREGRQTDLVEKKEILDLLDQGT
jgi:hypothetical protein